MGTNSPQKDDIERFSVSVPRDIYQGFEEMRKQIGISRSQAIRNAMHLFVEKEAQNMDYTSGSPELTKLADMYTLGTIYMLMKHSHWGITRDHKHDEPHIFSQGHSSDPIIKKHISDENDYSMKDQDYSEDEDDENLQENEQEYANEHEHEHGHEHEHEHEHEHKENEEISRYINVLEADVLKNMEIQHEFHDVIISVTHIHAEHDICLESLIVKGKISRIQSLYSKLRKLRSVIDVRLFIALSH